MSDKKSPCETCRHLWRYKTRSDSQAGRCLRTESPHWYVMESAWTEPFDPIWNISECNKADPITDFGGPQA